MTLEILDDPDTCGDGLRHCRGIFLSDNERKRKRKQLTNQPKSKRQLLPEALSVDGDEEQTVKQKKETCQRSLW